MSRFFLLLKTSPRFADAPAAAPAAAPSSAPATSPAAAPSSAPATTPAAGPSAAPSSAAPATAAPAGGGFDFRNELKSLGIQGEFADDKAAFDAFANHARQLQAQQQFAQVGQQVMPHLSEFQKWQKQQADQAAADAAKQQKSWWQPPEWNQQWMDAVETDPSTGRTIAKPGYDPTIPSKIEAFRAFQRETFQKFCQDPMALLKPGLEEFVKAQAQQLIEKQLGSYQMNQSSEQLVQQNAGWIYEQNPNNGGIKTDAQGRRVLSIAGQYMHKYCLELGQAGINDQKKIWDYAIEMTRATLIQLQQQQNPAAPAQAAVAPAAAPAPTPGTNRLQTLDPNGAGRRDAVPRQDRPSLKQRMMGALDRAGIQDIDFKRN
jgi:hypothetical protein